MSEVTLGAAARHVESGAVLDARETAGRLQQEIAAARAAASAAEEARREEHGRRQHLEQELAQLRVRTFRKLL